MLDNFASSFIDVASGISSFNVPFGKAWIVYRMIPIRLILKVLTHLKTSL